jgi:hypothetical protein
MTRTQSAYHASFTQYAIGAIVKAEERLPIKSRAQVEAVLKQLQPHGVISRTRGLFVAHSAAHAKRYLQAQPNPHMLTIHVYEVMVPRLADLPMALVDCIAKAIDHYPVNEMAAEYWNPTEEWNFLESVVDEMEIIAVCKDIDLMALACALMDYERDVKRASERWPFHASI